MFERIVFWELYKVSMLYPTPYNINVLSLVLVIISNYQRDVIESSCLTCAKLKTHGDDRERKMSRVQASILWKPSGFRRAKKKTVYFSPYPLLSQKAFSLREILRLPAGDFG